MLNNGILTLGNITWLLAAMSFVIAPHVTRLPIWVTACCVVAGAWRFWIARKGLHAPSWWLMSLLAVGITAGTYVEYRRLFGREVGVTLLIVMLCLKILEMKMKRDVIIVIFLGFFLALTNFLYSQTIFMGAYVFGCVWIFMATLIGFQRINTEATLKERLVPSGWLILQAIPMMLQIWPAMMQQIGGNPNAAKSALEQTLRLFRVSDKQAWLMPPPAPPPMAVDPATGQPMGGGMPGMPPGMPPEIAAMMGGGAPPPGVRHG